MKLHQILIIGLILTLSISAFIFSVIAISAKPINKPEPTYYLLLDNNETESAVTLRHIGLPDGEIEITVTVMLKMATVLKMPERKLIEYRTETIQQIIAKLYDNGFLQTGANVEIISINGEDV